VILPRSEFVDSREIRIGHITWATNKSNARNIDPNMIAAKLGDCRAFDAVLHYSEDAKNAVEAPDGHGGVEPVVVPVVAPFEDYVVPSRC
jgi:hypothetical protein